MKYLTNEDEEWLKARFPDLSIYFVDGLLDIQGNLVIDMFYDETSSEDKYIIFPDKVLQPSIKYIKDIYEVRIIFREDRFIPSVYETAGRIRLFAQRNDIKLYDLHVNDSDDLCLCPKSLERIKLGDSYTIQDFFTILLIPFFYAQSFYEKNNRWPWHDYSHGDMGLLEAYADCSINSDSEVLCRETYIALKPNIQSVITSEDSITRQSMCLCNSRDKFRNCHRRAWAGIKKLKKDYFEQHSSIAISK